MSVDFIALFFNPYILMFGVVAIGSLLGQIKIKQFAFGASGALFVGLIVGYFVVKRGSNLIQSNDYHADMIKQVIDAGVINKQFLSIFLVMFVASVGLMAAASIKNVLKKYGLKFFIMAGIMATFGAVMVVLFARYICPINTYQLSGMYTGALTTTPGLAAAIEVAENSIINNQSHLNAVQMNRLMADVGSQISIGYAMSYPFGVMCVVLAITLIPKLFGIDIDAERKKYNATHSSQSSTDNRKEGFDLIAFALVCWIGYLLGLIKVNLLGVGVFQLGATGGVLLSALLLGQMGKIGPLSFRMDAQILAVFRQFGLTFFLAVVGLRFGYDVINTMLAGDLSIVFGAMIINLSTVILGFIIGRYIFGINWMILSGALSGSMTSTPALGAAIESTSDDAAVSGYGATYPFALIIKVFITMILQNIPM